MVRDQKGKIVRNTDSAEPIQKATKCDLCAGQLTGPACQNACPHQAMVRIDMSDPQSLIDYFEEGLGL